MPLPLSVSEQKLSAVDGAERNENVNASPSASVALNWMLIDAPSATDWLLMLLRLGALFAITTILNVSELSSSNTESSRAVTVTV